MVLRLKRSTLKITGKTLKKGLKDSLVANLANALLKAIPPTEGRSRQGVYLCCTVRWSAVCVSFYKDLPYDTHKPFYAV